MATHRGRRWRWRFGSDRPNRKRLLGRGWYDLGVRSCHRGNASVHFRLVCKWGDAGIDEQCSLDHGGKTGVRLRSGHAAIATRFYRFTRKSEYALDSPGAFADGYFVLDYGVNYGSPALMFTAHRLRHRPQRLLRRHARGDVRRRQGRARRQCRARIRVIGPRTDRYERNSR